MIKFTMQFWNNPIIGVYSSKFFTWNPCWITTSRIAKLCALVIQLIVFDGFTMTIHPFYQTMHIWKTMRYLQMINQHLFCRLSFRKSY